MDWPALRLSLWLGFGTVVILLPFALWLGRHLALRRFVGRGVLEAAVALRPDFPRMLVNLAAAQLANARADDAIATLEK